MVFGSFLVPKPNHIMNRNIYTKALLSLGVAAFCQTTFAKNPTNVLFILADDLGWNDISCMGSEYHETPNIDDIARDGVKFTNGYAACQVSSPSRASLMTGKYTTRHGVTDWIGEASGEEWRAMNRNTKLLPADYSWEVSKDEITLPEYLRERGYVTFMAGKWHLGEEGSWPEDHGFDINKGGWSSGSPKGGYFSPWINPKLENKTKGEDLSLRLAQETNDFITAQVRDKKSKPFFAYLSFYAVHGPIETTEEKWRYFRDKAEAMGIADEGFAVDRTLPVRQHQDNPVYAGLLQQMDDAIGEVINNLKELGIYDDTLIIFTSDNGGVTSGDAYSTSLLPLRGGKGRQFEGGIRVPVLVKAPNNINSGKECDTPVIGIDFYPTILDYAELPANKKQGVDGVSIAPLVDGKDIAPRSLFWHYPHYGNQGGEPSSVIRKGDWKLIHYYEDGRDELYNLAMDISEYETLNHLNPEKVAELRAELDEWLEDTRAEIPTADTQYSPQKEHATKLNWKTKTKATQEKLREAMLRDEWQPNATWWGSNPTID